MMSMKQEQPDAKTEKKVHAKKEDWQTSRLMKSNTDAKLTSIKYPAA